MSSVARGHLTGTPVPLATKPDNYAMKVLDLQCGNGHVFEGWFGSEEDFQAQRARAMVQCPMCGDHGIAKKLSAPRLSLSSSQPAGEQTVDVATSSQASSGLAAAWLAMARHVVANSTDVGNRFAEEARKMHYGEIEEQSIRGKTTPQEARELQEEGIEVLPLLLPEAAKEPLQ